MNPHRWLPPLQSFSTSRGVVATTCGGSLFAVAVGEGVPPPAAEDGDADGKVTPLPSASPTCE